MRLSTPRIIAIDDDPKHLEGLTQGLSRYGAACLPIHFTGEAAISSCPHVRVIFADLHLSGGSPGTHAQDFAMIGGLIEDMIQPSGPYFIVLWTQYPDRAADLYDFLVQRLQNVARPFTVKALDKNDHLDPKDNVKNPKALVEAITRIISKEPQIGALLSWEERVLDATADTVSSITAMAEAATKAKAAGAEANPGIEIGRILQVLAVEAVGSKRVDSNRFRAVNEALLPILADRIASMRSRDADDEIWRKVLDGAKNKKRMTLEEAAKLNGLLHIEFSLSDKFSVLDGAERGAVIELLDKFLVESFMKTFGIESEEAMQKQFQYKREENDDKSAHWVLVQTQAACDYAQNQPGPLPFHLGLWLPKSQVSKDRPPNALWRSPCFEHEKNAWVLHVSGRFPVSLTKERLEKAPRLFRLREQLLNDLIYQIHGYGARPGIISFRS